MSFKLSLEALEVLDAIERKGSFAAAAADLYRVPSAITYSVQKLEEDLGVVLFRKQGRRSLLTPAGKVLLEQGRELLLAADRLVEKTRQVSRGWESRLSIAVDTAIELPSIYPLVEQLYQLQPDIEINLYEEVLAGSWEAVVCEKADLAIGTMVPPNMSELCSKAVCDIDWVFAVSKNHPLAQCTKVVTPEIFQQYRAVVVRDSSSTVPAVTVRVLEKQPVLKVSSMEQKIMAQIQGLGVGYLPAHRVQQHIESGDLVSLPFEDNTKQHSLNAVWRTSNKGRALRWFIDALDQWQLKSKIMKKMV